MTTCAYCHLPVETSEIALGDNDVWQHSDIKFCASALKRRVAELEAELATEKAYAVKLAYRLELYMGKATVAKFATQEQP